MKTIVLIHGMYMNDHSWQPWVRWFRQRGYQVHTPVWPFHNGDPATMRMQIDPGLGRLRLRDVVASIEAYIDPLSEPPLLIGHSMGGLVVQKLINRGKGSAGICIDTAPPRGLISTQWSFWKGNWPHINPFAGNQPCRMTVDRFQYTFCNTMSRAETVAAFEHYVVPESRNVPRSTLFADGAIDFRIPHAPLLFIAGEKDTIIPWKLNRRNARAYRHAGSTVDFKVFPNRTHFICNQTGWEEVAQFCQAWFSA